MKRFSDNWWEFVFRYILSLLIAVGAGPAWAATYYVDDANGSDANPGTSAQPWLTRMIMLPVVVNRFLAVE